MITEKDYQRIKNRPSYLMEAEKECNESLKRIKAIQEEAVRKLRGMLNC